MSLRRPVRPRLYVLLAALCILPGLSILASFWWLKQQPDELVFLLTGIAGTVTILAGLALGIIHDRTIDEWQKSNTRFAGFWGEAVGTSLVALLLLLPAGREWIVSVVAQWADTPNPDSKLVILAFTFGFAALVTARIVCMAVLSTGWTLWKSRSAREIS